MKQEKTDETRNYAFNVKGNCDNASLSFYFRVWQRRWKRMCLFQRPSPGYATTTGTQPPLICASDVQSISNYFGYFFFLVQMNKRCVSSTAVWLRGLPPYLSTSGVSLSFSLSLSKHTHSLTLTLTHTNFSLFRTLTATHYYHSIFNVIVVKVTCKPSIRSHQQL